MSKVGLFTQPNLARPEPRAKHVHGSNRHRVLPPRGQLNSRHCYCCSKALFWRLFVAVVVIVIVASAMMMDWPMAPRQRLLPKAQPAKHVVHLRPGIIHHVHSSSQRNMSRLPQCIIIGVRKAGTTALLTFLNLHPDIVSALKTTPDKEVHFFNKNENYAKGYRWYLEQMPVSSPSQLTIEKSPAYFVTEGVPQRIHDMNSSIKLLLVVREPVERAISDYLQRHWLRLSRNKTDAPFEDQVIDETTGKVNIGHPVLDRSIYHKHLKPWLEIFTRKQIHVVDGDQLVRDPVKELASVETFLGLSHRLDNSLFAYNASRGFYCIQTSNGEQCLSDSKGRHHTTVDAKVLEKLRKFYRPHNDRFFRAINKTFPWS